MSVKTIEAMVEWVEENIESDPTLEAMSFFVGYSPYYCSAKFHEYVGTSFKEYILKRKLALAALELKRTDIKIIDIAVKYGFSSQAAFTRAFVKAYGYTPFRFRKLSPEIRLYNKAHIV